MWAFGCVLYEMLTGQRAFEGEDVSDTLAAVLRASRTGRRSRRETSHHVVGALLRRCLEKDRRRRIAEFSTALFIIDDVSRRGR